MKKIKSIIFFIFIVLSSIYSEEINTYDILFFPDSDKIKLESYPDLEKILSILNSNNKYLIILKGYTNSLGMPQNELVLSKQRANKIALYLKNNGISLSKIKSDGYGGKNLKENKITSVNRRVEVYILKSKTDLKFTEKSRKFKITILDNEKNRITSNLIIKMRNYETNKIEHEENFIVKKPIVIDIPISKKIEFLIVSDGYIPQKFIINQDEEEKIVYLQKIKKGITFSLNCIYFDINKSNLKSESFDIINNVIDLMKKNKNLKLEIRGHTDNNAPGNMKLSKLRAKAVVDYMINNGIKSDRLTYKGFGGTKPIAKKTSIDGRSKNRRTEFYVSN